MFSTAFFPQRNAQYVCINFDLVFMVGTECSFMLTFIDPYEAVAEAVELNHGQEKRRAMAGQSGTAGGIRQRNIPANRNR